MQCRNCKVAMILGTAYGQKKNHDGSNKFMHRRFIKCPKCGDIQYNNLPNFQEIPEKISTK